MADKSADDDQKGGGAQHQWTIDEAQDRGGLDGSLDEAKSQQFLLPSATPPRVVMVSQHPATLAIDGLQAQAEPEGQKIGGGNQASTSAKLYHLTMQPGVPAHAKLQSLKENKALSDELTSMNQSSLIHFCKSILSSQQESGQLLMSQSEKLDSLLERFDRMSMNAEIERKQREIFLKQVEDLKSRITVMEQPRETTTITDSDEACTKPIAGAVIVGRDLLQQVALAEKENLGAHPRETPTASLQQGKSNGDDKPLAQPSNFVQQKSQSLSLTSFTAQTYGLRKQALMPSPTESVTHLADSPILRASGERQPAQSPNLTSGLGESQADARQSAVREARGDSSGERQMEGQWGPWMELGAMSQFQVSGDGPIPVGAMSQFQASHSIQPERAPLPALESRAVSGRAGERERASRGRGPRRRGHVHSMLDQNCGEEGGRGDESESSASDSDDELSDDGDQDFCEKSIYVCGRKFSSRREFVLVLLMMTSVSSFVLSVILGFAGLKSVAAGLVVSGCALVLIGGSYEMSKVFKCLAEERAEQAQRQAEMHEHEQDRHEYINEQHSTDPGVAVTRVMTVSSMHGPHAANSSWDIRHEDEQEREARGHAGGEGMRRGWRV